MQLEFFFLRGIKIFFLGVKVFFRWISAKDKIISSWVQKCGNREKISQEEFRRYARSRYVSPALSHLPPRLTCLRCYWSFGMWGTAKQGAEKILSKKERAVSLGIVLLDYWWALPSLPCDSEITGNCDGSSELCDGLFLRWTGKTPLRRRRAAFSSLFGAEIFPSLANIIKWAPDEFVFSARRLPSHFCIFSPMTNVVVSSLHNWLTITTHERMSAVTRLSKQKKEKESWMRITIHCVGHRVLLGLTADLISRPTPGSFVASWSSANGSTRQIMKARGSISVSFDLASAPEAVELDLPGWKRMSFEAAFISDFCDYIVRALVTIKLKIEERGKNSLLPSRRFVQLRFVVEKKMRENIADPAIWAASRNMSFRSAELLLT